VAEHKADYDRAEDLHLKSLDVCRAHDDDSGAGRALCALADVALHRADYAEAEPWLQESLRLGSGKRTTSRSSRRRCCRSDDSASCRVSRNVPSIGSRSAFSSNAS
jgi:tetratricopeptide repeat protein